ncbi:hypothetical protein ACKFKG_00025 [Phormidesmis sp. 146-35]
MIHHISIAVNNPQHVANVIAELWQGQAVPFPGHEGSYVAFAFDSYGTAIEVMPKSLILKPGLETAPVQFYDSNFNTRYTATHANIAVPISEAKIWEIADREGWRAVRCRRAGLIDLIEFWVENQVLLELLPPNLMSEYLAVVQPESLKAALRSLAS